MVTLKYESNTLAVTVAQSSGTRVSEVLHLCLGLHMYCFLFLECSSLEDPKESPSPSPFPLLLKCQLLTEFFPDLFDYNSP